MTFVKGILLMLATIAGIWSLFAIIFYQLAVSGIVTDWLSTSAYALLIAPFVAPLYWTMFECACDMLKGGGEDRK